MSDSTKSIVADLDRPPISPDRRQFLSVGTASVAAGLASVVATPVAFAQSGPKAPDAPSPALTKCRPIVWRRLGRMVWSAQVTR